MIHTTQTWEIGDAIDLMQKMPDSNVDLVFTSPPYWQQRDYGSSGQFGLENTISEYVDNILRATHEIKRVLKHTGVFCLNIGDTYYGSGGAGGDYAENGLRDGQPKYKQPKKDDYKSKCMCGIPERVMLGCIDQGWILRDKIIWAKKVWFAKTNKTIGNCMPGSQTDRCTFSYEPVYMFTKSQKYRTYMDAIRVPYTEPMNRWGGDKLEAIGNDSWDAGTGQSTYRDRDMRPNDTGSTSPNVWQINTKPYTSGLDDVEHFATFPPAIVERIVTAFCPAEICPVCGMARERIVQKDIGKNKATPYETKTDFIHHGEGASTLRTDIKRSTIGWTSCSCNAGWIAGTVLDPFCGSGTMLEVCRLLNRNAIGLELNPEYEPLIKERSMAHTPPLTAYFSDGE